MSEATSITQSSSLLNDDFQDLDGQAQIDTLLSARLKAFKNERAEVKLLLEAAARCEEKGLDAKAEALLDWIYRLQADESDPNLKVLVFTEFIPTQQMLHQFLTERGFQVVCLNGSLDMVERKTVQDDFAGTARILISTDAGGEGLNLQFCHVVINYDIPWNPMRLEQRIGRVDRIGQPHVVRAINFVFEDSVEHRVREVLEKKLAVIFEDLGIDKTGDVLDSAQAGEIFDDLYVDAILNPEDVDASIEKVVTRLQEQARNTRASTSILGSAEDLLPAEAQRILTHPLPHWIERMTVCYLQSHGGQAVLNKGAWNLTWPEGEQFFRVVFSGKEAEQTPAARHLTLEDPRIRGLAMRLPRFAPGQPVTVATIGGLPGGVTGLWSLWRIGIATVDWNRYRIMPLFLTDQDKAFGPTARHVWDQLMNVDPCIRGTLGETEAERAFVRLSKAAEDHGRTIYDELVQEHRLRLQRETEKGEYAFAARRKIIERVGLPEVRNYRLNLLLQEEECFYEDLARKKSVFPEMAPLVIIKVMGNES